MSEGESGGVPAGGSESSGVPQTGSESGAAPKAGGIPEGRGGQAATGQQSERVYRFNQEWVKSLAPELQQLVAKYDNDPLLAIKALRSAGDALSKRKEQFTDSDLETFRSYDERVHGVPKGPDGYDFQFEKLSEHSQPALGEDFANALKKTFHDAGVSQKGAQKIYSFLNEFSSQSLAAVQENNKKSQVEAYNSLKKDWGEAFQENIGYAERAFKDILPQMGVDSELLQQELQNLDLKYFPEIMKTLSGLGRFFSSSPRRGYNNMSPVDAKVELEQLRTNADFQKAFASIAHKDHAKALETFARLNKKAYGI
jgi:hypothetical protein